MSGTSPMEQAETLIGQYVPDFELPGVDGAVHHLARYLETWQGVGLVFIGNQCPCVQGYLERLKQLQTDFQDQGFTLIAINANDTTEDAAEGLDSMKAFAQTHQLNFPYLRDVTQEIAQGFGATQTPEAFLIDQQGKLRYWGAIDDSPEAAPGVRNPHFRTAVSQLLNGESIIQATVPAGGSSIKWQA